MCAYIYIHISYYTGYISGDRTSPSLQPALCNPCVYLSVAARQDLEPVKTSTSAQLSGFAQDGVTKLRSSRQSKCGISTCHSLQKKVASIVKP